MTKQILSVLALSFLLSSCGGGESKATEETVSEEEVVVEELATDENEPLTVLIEANDQMKYNLSRIDASMGQEITLTLKNVGEMPKASMGHNFILFQKGVDVQAFAMEAMNAKETDYLPSSLMSDVLAHTSLLGPGEEETILFNAPDEAGPYKFICSFPGHFASMQGILFVQ